MISFKAKLAWLRIALGGIYLSLGLLTGCQKLCQPTSGQTFPSVTAAQWRLAQTTDPQIAPSLNNYNFLIVQFDATFGGTVTQVQNNKAQPTPAATIAWKEPSSNTMQIQFSSGKSGTKAGDLGTFNYSYKLSHELELNRNDGYYYRYVQFNGVVNPDSNCTF